MTKNDWILVPREATEEMLDAVGPTIAESGPVDLWRRGGTAKIYTAMISTAPGVGEEVVERITEMLGLWRGTEVSGCFAPDYIDSCDDTGCWCKKECARNARAILALFTQKET